MNGHLLALYVGSIMVVLAGRLALEAR